MLIRSQRGIMIVDLDSCTMLDATLNEGNGTITARSENKIYRLGFYESIERCKEVLDEICNAYISLNNFKGNAPYVKNGIYQMPEE